MDNNDIENEEELMDDQNNSSLNSYQQQNQGNKFKQNQMLNQAKQNMAKEALKTAANASFGPAAGAAVDALSKTKTGQKILNEASNISPFKKNSFLGVFFGKKEDKVEEHEGEGEISVKNTNKMISLLGLGTLSLSGCFAFFIILLVICTIISPLFYINSLMNNISNNVSTFNEKLGNFLTLRGWCTDEECQKIEEEDFYNHVKEVYDKYLREKNVEINKELIIATLTYADPLVTIDNSLENGDEENETAEDETNLENIFQTSNIIDFKKSKSKVEMLARNMVSEVVVCYDSNNNEVDCADKTITDKTTKKYWELDIDKYKEYLEVYFIRYFYYDNKHGDDVNAKIRTTIEDIFLRVKFYEYIAEINGYEDGYNINGTTVTVLDCNTDMVIAELSLYEYLQGVLYVEGYATQRPLEFLKVMAVVAKNYLYALNGATVDNIPTNLRIKSCAMNQIYCSVTDGCYNMGDGVDEDHNTITIGPDSSGNYFSPPLTDTETLNKIKEAIDATFTEFLISGNDFINTQYRASCETEICDSTTNIMDQSVAYQMIQEGKTYTDVLNYFFKGNVSNIEEIVDIGIAFTGTVGYPLDPIHKTITSTYGSRWGDFHYGLDISAPANSPIYSIADGVILINEYHYSWGNYTKIGHNYNPETGRYEFYSLYAHQIKLSSFKPGDQVQAGQQIGLVGSTGYSTGNHLHIEIRDSNDNRVDPYPYLSKFFN